MTPPADLAALRALVEAVTRATTPQSLMEQGLLSTAARDIAAVRAALPAAREALERVEGSLESSRLAGVSARCNRASDAQIIATLRARIARLEEALGDSTVLLRSVRDENDEGGIAAQVAANRAALERAMSKPTVRVRLDVYQFDGRPENHEEILVEPDGIFHDRVVLVVGGHRYTVIAGDLADAAQRARKPR